MTRIYCDSSTREACIVVEGEDPIVIPYPEPVTVNVGEYKAVIIALEEALNRRLEEVEILTDSLLVVNQVRGLWKCRKKHLRPYCNWVRFLLPCVSIRGCELNWIPREENPAGKVLE